MKRITIIFLICVVSISLSSVAFASAPKQSLLADFQELINQLKEKIKSLQVQIGSLKAEPSTVQEEFTEVGTEIKSFTTILRRGTTGEEVKQLQEFLKQYPDIYPEGLATGYFGPLTEKAVQRWQKKQGIVSSGDPESTGYGQVGPQTRVKINELLTKGVGASGIIPPGLITAPGIQKKVATTTATTSGRKITICHYPPDNPDNRHTIEIAESALEAHLAHGDTVGPCPDEPEPELEPTPTPTPCSESWNCGSWSSCVNNTQTRICTDTNNCGTTNVKPAISQGCTPTPTPTPDTTPPVISNVQAVDAPFTTVPLIIVTWQTDEASDSVVDYGLTTSYGYTASKETFVNSHKVYVESNLIEGKTYHYRVSSTDTSGNKAQSIDKTFTVPDITAPNKVTNFSAIGGDRQITLSWTNPTNEDFAGVKIIRRSGGNPDITVYTGTGTRCVDTNNLVNEIPYGYQAVTYDEQQNYSSGVWVQGTPALLPGHFLLSWGSYGSGDGQFRHPTGVSIDNNGNVYVTDRVNNRVQKFSSNGVFIIKWGSEGSGDGQFANSIDVAVDSNNNVYVVDYYHHRIQKFTSNGTFIKKWGSQGSGDAQFNYPVSIAIDSNDNVYVVDYDYVRKFTSNGVFVKKWGSLGHSEFNSPPAYHPTGNGIDVDVNNNIYVLDYHNKRVQKFTSDGILINEWTGGYIISGGSTPRGMAVDPASSEVYIGDHGTRTQIQKFTNDGVYLTKWGSGGSGYGEFKFIYDIAVDADGNIYVVDTGNYRIQKFSSE